MIFNSLGSNYDFKFIIRSLFSIPKSDTNRKLIFLLEKRYGGNCILLYKGREAIKLALDISGLPKGSKVGVNGFTCFVVYQAIVEAGYEPVYIDIDGRSLNYNISTIEKAVDIKALIIQNTLGNPVDINPIVSFCNKRGILIIEDMAHSVGSRYSTGVDVGTIGDFTALSFSQDKSIDSVSGGALVVRNKKFISKLNNIELASIDVDSQLLDRIYPSLTFQIRKLYSVYLGKLFHFIIKKIKLLSDPMGKLTQIRYHRLQYWYANLALNSFSNLDKKIKHSKKIVEIYLSNLNEKIVSKNILGNYDLSSNIRFPIFVNNRNSLIKFLKENQIYVSDIWYDSPVAPSKLMSRTNYADNCPESEKISKQIVNLPTHINVSVKEAERISALINKWQNTQQN